MPSAAGWAIWRCARIERHRRHTSHDAVVPRVFTLLQDGTQDGTRYTLWESILLHTTQTDACKLAVQDIHKRFGDNEVLKGVSMNANKGDVISIIGASGSGKSTFLRCINFLERPNAGQIVVDGEAVRTKTDRAGNLEVADHKQLQRIRTKLAMVFQHFNLWAHMNVLENVKIGRASCRERVSSPV